MGVRIRLSRVGKKHVPFFRLVAVDSRKKRDGKVLSHIGTYDALEQRVVQFYDQELDKWMKNGALLTQSAKKIVSLYRKTGIYIAPTKHKDNPVVNSLANQEEVRLAPAE